MESSIQDEVNRVLEQFELIKLTEPKMPCWPPDVFAICATVVERTECYINSHFHRGVQLTLKEVSYPSQDGDTNIEKNAEHVGNEWGLDLQREGKPYKSLNALWRSLFAKNICNANAEMTVMFLMIAADTACRGIGFLIGPNHAGQMNQAWRVYLTAYMDYLEWDDKKDDKNSNQVKPKTPNTLPHLPKSLCLQVAPNSACVQPKGISPMTGISLSRFCNHLALLPGQQSATTYWVPNLIHRVAAETNKTFNILVVPFPYEIDGNSFRVWQEKNSTKKQPSGPESGEFDTKQTWLQGMEDSVDAHINPENLFKFVKNLIIEARREVRRVHMVVFPEGALDALTASHLVWRFQSDKDLQLVHFVTGVTLHVEGGAPRNVAYVRYFTGPVQDTDAVLIQGTDAALIQDKHHRWCIDPDQIRRYNLGGALPPATKYWWEKMEVRRRSCCFVGLDQNVFMSVLICEDLARVEPAQYTVRAVGPNLVLALLMDGPQLKDRWPARYATVLADEPGASVLTVNCVGMVRRSRQHRSDEAHRGHEIALWKEFGGDAKELQITDKGDALVLTLSMECRVVHTPDGRKDTLFDESFDLSTDQDGGTIRLRLTGVREIVSSDHSREETLKLGPLPTFDCPSIEEITPLLAGKDIHIGIRKGIQGFTNYFNIQVKTKEKEFAAAKEFLRQEGQARNF